MAHRQPMTLFASAMAAGIAIDAAVDGGVTAWVLCFVALAVAAWWGPGTTRSIAVVALFVPLGAARRSVNEANFAAGSPWADLDTTETPCVVEGVVTGIPTLRQRESFATGGRDDEDPWQTGFEISLQKIRDRQRDRPIAGRFRVMVDGRRDDLKPGDRVRVYGELSRTEPPSNPGQPDFRVFDRRQGIHGRIRVRDEDQIVWLDANRWHPGRVVASLGRRARETLLSHLGETTRPLAVALVIGQRSFVTPAVRERLMETGTAHLLSVSGLHLAIIVAIAHTIGTLLRLPKSWGLLWTVAVSVFYVAITGGRPPVVRAAILVVTVAVALVLRRPAQTLNTLGLAAIVLMFWNPENLFSVGVHLSFLAVATLVIGSPGRFHVDGRVDPTGVGVDPDEAFAALADSARGRWHGRLRRWIGWVGMAVWYSGCVTAVTTPLVWHQFHVVSPISVVTNVIVMPCLFVALAAGVATVVLGWIAAPLAFIPATVCHVTLWWIDGCIRAAAAVPWGHFWLPSPPTWAVCLFYVFLLTSLLIPRRRDSAGRDGVTDSLSRVRRRWLPHRPGRTARVAFIAIWIPMAWWTATTPKPLPRGTLEATFVDVGHGTAVVIRTARHEAWLYDCGRLGNRDGRSEGIDETLWSLGFTRLEGVFLSHADADHFNSLPGVLRHFSVGRILTPHGMLDRPGESLASIRRRVRDDGVPVTELSAGDTCPTAGSRVDVLHPPPTWIPGNNNANSLVLRIDHAGAALLLPGDLEPPGTERLIGRPRLPPGSVLMAPHHGSVSADVEPMLRWCRPRETIVSGGSRARNPEVARMLAVTGSGVHVTSVSGAIRVRIGPEGELEIRSWLESPW